MAGSVNSIAFAITAKWLKIYTKKKNDWIFCIFTIIANFMHYFLDNVDSKGYPNFVDTCNV